VKLHHVGAVVSNTIPSLTSTLSFNALSLNFIYTVLAPSQAVSVHAFVIAHVSQFVGFVVFPYAISTGFDKSVGHVIFNVTEVDEVVAALLLIVKLHPVGGVISFATLQLTCEYVIISASTHPSFHTPFSQVKVFL